MSLNDPLIRDLKGHTLRLHQDAMERPITDFHPTLQAFCQTLEIIFRKGLKGLATAVGVTRQDYWLWIQNLPNVIQPSTGVSDKAYSVFKTSIEMTQKTSKVRTVQGRGRYFIRLALVKNIITVPVVLLSQYKPFRQKMYDPQVSILADDLFTEVLLSALQEVTELNFALNIKNSSFLDETWLLPVYKSYEFVPCDSLGIKVGYVKGRAVAVNISAGSIAAEDDKIEVGDILDELYGESLYFCKKWKIPNLLKNHRGMPIQLDVVKGHFCSGELYPPAAVVIRQLGMNTENLVHLYRKREIDRRKHERYDDFITQFTENTGLKLLEGEKSENNTGFLVLYVGKVFLGKNGAKEMIIHGISEVLKESQTKQEVLLETQETHLAISDPKSKEVLYTHSYTMIGACGRPKSPQTYFAYTLGDTSCNLSKNFNCFVYQTRSAEASRDILQNIAKGFERTHWAV